LSLEPAQAAGDDVVEPGVGEFDGKRTCVDTRQLEEVVDELTQCPHPVPQWRR
jgi:imidazoleglycerol phosphate synthase glutamine amidotransferase subunit HisH